MSVQAVPFPQQTNAPFRKTKKQIEACDMMNRHTHTLLYGGSRSGKTFIEIRNMVLRALKTPSRHLITRFRFNHAKTSIWYDTLPKVMKLCFPKIPYKENKSDWFITLPAQNGLGESQIWLGGIDDKERVDKILGNEYSTILANEVSQIEYDAIIALRSRLAENSGLNLRFYYDLNPVGKKHWTYQEFIRGVIPGTEEATKLNLAFLAMNPYDNVENLPPEYLEILKSFPKRQRQRFLDGLFLTDVEGALWTDSMISAAKTRGYGEIVEIVVAVDPAVSSNPNSNETGIIIVGRDEFGHGVVLDDLSGVMSTGTWARRVAWAYHHYNANKIVVEVNQGGTLVRDALKNVDLTVKIVDVRASVGKKARAEPVSELYEPEIGYVAHAKDLPELESQLTEWVPMDTDESPDRLDAMVWGLTHLCVKKLSRFHVG